jgi:hypothetical protein
MNALVVVVLIFAASVFLLIAPAIRVLRLTHTSRGCAVGILLVQFLPVILVVAYYWYSSSHLRIPLFSYQRPTFEQVSAVIAMLQFIGTASILWAAQLSLKWKSLFTVGAVLASVGVAAIGSAVSECANGNCF